MKLHEVVDMENERINASVMRVPGGWLYIFTADWVAGVQGIQGTTFVPYNNEFQ